MCAGVSPPDMPPVNYSAMYLAAGAYTGGQRNKFFDVANVKWGRAMTVQFHSEVNT